MGNLSSRSNMSAAESNDLANFVNGEVAKHQVVIWSKTTCGFCRRTKAIFDEAPYSNADVKIYELNTMSNVSAELISQMKTIV